MLHLRFHHGFVHGLHPWHHNCLLHGLSGWNLCLRGQGTSNTRSMYNARRDAALPLDLPSACSRTAPCDIYTVVFIDCTRFSSWFSFCFGACFLLTAGAHSLDLAPPLLTYTHARMRVFVAKILSTREDPTSLTTASGDDTTALKPMGVMGGEESTPRPRTQGRLVACVSFQNPHIDKSNSLTHLMLASELE